MDRGASGRMISGGISRRSVIKAGAVAGASILAAPSVRRAFAQEKVINWLAYSGHSADEVIGPFVKQTGIEIRAKEYADGEKMLALVHGSAPGTYDVVTSDAPYVALLVKSGLLAELDPSDYDLDAYYPEFRKWPQHRIDGKLMALIRIPERGEDPWLIGLAPVSRSGWSALPK